MSLAAADAIFEVLFKIFLRSLSSMSAADKGNAYYTAIYTLQTPFKMV